MLSLRFYYALKPFLPWRMRMALRRISARRKRKHFAAVWPINESTSQPPAGWPGWPEGKKFAFVITHDVEGPDGLAKCRQLAELEMQLGFRSCFNFIPEGPYQVPPELRAWLTKNGFEVGVHDLNHDGKLFTSQSGFIAKAQRINHYLREWQARGYRSGFMLRNLDWLHELAIGYDSSTFDTDPFEPQPDGAGTIFPYWIPSPHATGDKDEEAEGKGGETGAKGSPPQPSASSPPPSVPYPLPLSSSAPPPQRAGYVELPYTLPQDSTLFLLLQEKTPEIWLRKLDWIAGHGGMALINVHPDYLCFEGTKQQPHTFPVSFYADLLRCVRERYAVAHWPALPKEVALHVHEKATFGPLTAPTVATSVTSSRPSFPMKKNAGRIVMLLENRFPDDTRVRNEANMLTAAGYKISVICLKGLGQSSVALVDGVRVYRVPQLELFEKTVARPGLLGRLVLQAKSLLGYGIEYLYFTSACFFLTVYIFVRYGFDVIHAHNPPDTLFLVALPFRFLGKKFVFDHHDLCPELYMSRYRTGECVQTHILRAAEWCTLRMAHITIATNESYKRTQIDRGGRDPNTIFVVRNGPNTQRMDLVPPSPRLRNMDKRILIYIGSLNPQDGVDYLLRSLAYLRHELKRSDFHCVVIGSGDSLGDLRGQATELHLNDCVELPGYISYAELQANLAAADICVDPDPSSPLNDVSTWIKIMEYMAYAKPIVTYDLNETRVSAQDAAMYVRPNDEHEFARAIACLMDAPGLRKTMGEYGRKRVEEHLQWSVVGQNLVSAYHYLLGPPAGAADATTQATGRASGRLES